MVVLSPSITAKPLLDVNQPSTVVQGTSSFEQVLAQVRAYQNQQASWQVQQQMANAQLKQSGLWTNPSISIEQTGLQIDQDRELAIGISQPLDLFGQRRAAQKVAKLSASQIDLEQQRYNAELELIVQYAWSQVALFQLEKSLIAEQLQVSQENLDATMKRYQAGSIAQVDVERVRVARNQDGTELHRRRSSARVPGGGSFALPVIPGNLVGVAPTVRHAIDSIKYTINMTTY